MPTATLFPNIDFALSTAWSKACELSSVEVRSSVFPPLALHSTRLSRARALLIFSDRSTCRG